MADTDVEATLVKLEQYKKLVGTAKKSLEEKQEALAAKDRQIQQLSAALEEEKASKLSRKHLTVGKDDENAHMPRNLIRRMDVDDVIWILIEYEGIDDSWKMFSSEQDLDDYIQRISSVPLQKPPRCLTAEESVQIVSYFVSASTVFPAMSIFNIFT